MVNVVSPGGGVMNASTTPPANPFVPDYDRPWDIRRVSHLLRRACFGVSETSLAETLAKSPREAIHHLLDYDPAVDPLNDLLEQLQGFVTFQEIKPVQEWCFYRMLYSPRPLQEKLMLFWHNRFATSAQKVDTASMMHGQMEMFRRQGIGGFRNLVKSIARDPAMLVWLDGQYNRKGKPNENFAREVMELFTLGINSYTEHDIRELARAFTGWQLNRGNAFFNKQLFDDGVKSIFNMTGPYDMDTSIDLILQQPNAPAFLAKHLLQEFVHPQPTEMMVKHYAGRLLATDWDVKAVLTEILSSRLFFSDWAYRSKIKSPIELAVGAVTALGGKVNTKFLREQTAKMGQNILFPPNVKGWDGEQDWINANTVMLRFNFGESLATQRANEFARKSDMEKWLLEHNIRTSDDIVDHYATLLLDGNLLPAVRNALLNYMNHGTKNEPAPFVLEQDALNAKVRGLLHLLMSMPEYQLC
jgi:uncharacterized protein (DUF1800 family)